MQSKMLSTFKITHFSGESEVISAENMEQALGNTSIPEATSPAVSASRIAYNIRTLFDDELKEILFTAVATDSTATLLPNSLATPASGTVHVGDEVTLQAIPERNYSFIAWKADGVVISNNATYNWTVPETEAITIALTAEFALTPVAWTTSVLPSEATGEGCLAFPTSGTTEANAEQEILAVAKGSYVFDHWERNGTNIGTNELLSTNVEPKAITENTVTYTAVFVTE